jgi:Domain of unknown function (DUF5916)/Carbohydrate family 9 binding domain-like
MHRAVVLFCLFGLPAGAAGQSTAPDSSIARHAGDTTQFRIARAARRIGEIRLDAKLDEPAWQTAPLITDFTQSYPKPGSKPTDATEARVLYDDDAIYVGVRMYDAHPDSIAAQLARRDASGIYSDWIHVIIDSYHDRRTSFRFTVNPRGVKKDVYTSNDFSEDSNWDAIWEVATRVDSAGWVAEYRIPLSQLRFGSAPSGQDRIWGFQIMRDIARRNERDSWSPWTPQAPGFVSRFGDLIGLTNVPSPRRFELVPYASTKLTRAPGDPANPFFRSTATKPSAGADLKYGLPAGLTLTATVNPDFGQVEVDPSVVNLTAFETFFPEKRPFFLEGSDVLNFGQVYLNNDYGSATYFYSRRIGRQPQRFAGGSGISFVDQPDQTRIAGAAKITGKAGPWTVGFLDAVTPEVKARVLTTAGVEDRSPVEPLTNYLAARLKHDFRNGGTVVGSMLTSTVRNLSDSVFKPLLRSSATFGGMDFEHDIQKKTWILSGFLAGSRVEGSQSAIAATQLNSTHYYQRPDASYLHFNPARNSLFGHTGEIGLAKTGNVYGSLAFKEMSPGFEINDVGFQGRADFRAISTDLGYHDFKAGKHLQQFGYYGYTNHTWDFGGTSILQSAGAGGYLTRNDFRQAGFGVGYNPRYFSDRFTRGGPIAGVPSSGYINVNAGTDSRKPVSLGVFASYFRDHAGGNNRSLSAVVDMRPSSFIHVTLSPGLGVQHSTAQFVRSVTDATATSTYGKRYVFADLHQTTLSMDTRIEWTFTPAVSLQVYAQPFVSAGRYENFKEFLNPGKYDFAVYGAAKGTITRSSSGTYTVDPDGPGAAASFQFGDPTFNIRNLRGNAVMRWEYRPGSAIFVVWQQQRSDFEPIGDFSTSRDVGAIFRTVPTNVFLIKATYWIGK